MMIWGNLVEAQQQRGEDEAVDLVPGSWQLVRHPAYGDAEVLAKGVLAYDLAEDGTIIYSNGNANFVRHPEERSERIHTARMIEQVVLLRG